MLQSCTTPLSLESLPHTEVGFSEIPTDLLCTEEEVCSYLLALDATKACGSDGLSAKMLKGTAASIAPAVTKLFNISLRQVELPSEWKHALIIPIPKTSERSNVTIDRYYCCQSWNG